MNRLSALVAAGLAVASTGCYTVKPVTFEAFGGQRVKQVWVTRNDQTVVFITNAEASGDKLRGYIDRQYKELPASDLQEIRVRQLNQGRTIALVAVSVGAAVAVAAMVSGSDNNEFDGCAGNPRCGEDTSP
jgi:hypothetical protein